MKNGVKTGRKTSNFHLADQYFLRNVSIKSSAIVHAVIFREDHVSYVVYPLPKLVIHFLSLLQSFHQQGALYFKVIDDTAF
jgi:hypothetical protein